MATKIEKKSKTTKIVIPSVEELFDVGAHFGHRREHSDARAKKFIYLTVDKTNIINLEETQKGLETALKFIGEKVKGGAKFLVVGTKTQAKAMAEKIGNQLDQAYVSGRWLGGTLTNFNTVKKSLKAITDLEKYSQSEEFEKLTKREKFKTKQKLAKLHKAFDGLLSLEKLPDALIVFGAKDEEIAVGEARETNVKIVGICDTDFNPNLLDCPIPANDDSQKTLELIGELIYNTIKNNLSTTPKAESKK